MKTRKILLVLVIGLILVISCNSDDDNDDNGNLTNCDLETIVSTQQYENAPSDELTINLSLIHI